jgi:hypothetical protein
MSKSISGSGSLNLTVQELRFLEIKASLISAINATIDALLTAVNANFTGLVTITDLTISGTVTVENITVLDTLTAEYIVANQGITGDLTGAVNIETTTPTNTGAFRLSFIDGANDGVTSTGNGLMASSNKLRFDESTGTLIVSDYITVPVLAVTTYALITPTTSTADDEYAVAMFGNGNELTGDSMTYNCFQNRLTVPNLQVTGALTLASFTVSDIDVTGSLTLTNPPTDNTDNNDRRLLFLGANNEVYTDTTLKFNPSTDYLYCNQLQVSQRIYSNLLYMANNADTDADETARIVFKRPTDGILATTSSFAYNSGLDKLLCGGAEFDGNVTATNITATGQVEINRYIATGNSDLNVLFLTAEDKIRISGDKPLTFNPNLGLLKSYDLQLDNELTVEANLNVNCPLTTGTGDNRIAFIEATAGTTNYGKGILSRGTLYWNNNNQTLFCQNILGQSLVYTPKLRVTAASGYVAGEFTIDANNGLTAQHGTSYSVKINNVKQFQIQETQTTFFNDVVMNNDLTINGNAVYTNVVANEFRNTFSDLPIGYTATYTCSQYDTLNSTFGMDDIIVLNNQASQGGTPTVHQFGKDVSLLHNNTFIRSPIDFGQSGNRQYWRLNGWQSSPTTNQKYVGCWEVTAFAIFQNLSQSRITPKMSIKKYNGVSYEDQPQISSSTGYTKSGNGSIISMVCQGCVKLSSISRLQLWTRADVNSIPVNTDYPDTVSSTDWTGIDLVISMKYLGFQTNVSNAL